MEKSEQEIIEEIYEILKNADCDLTHACTSCLIYTHVGEKNELPDEKGRKEAILRIIKLTLQKAKEIGLLTAASQMPKPLGKGMSTDSEIIETLSDLEHEQWMYWSKATLKNLRAMDSDEPDAFINAVTSVEIKWSPNWKPYSELSEEVKEHDRKWARKVFDVQASKIAELEKENRELKEQNSKLADELIQECCESWEAPYEDTACCDIPNMPFEDMCSTCRIVVKTKNLNRC